MGTNEIDKVVSDVQAFEKAGKYREAIAYLKEVLSRSKDLELRFMAARGVVYFIVLMSGEEGPSPMSPEYEEIETHARIAMKAFDSADSATQARIQETFDLDAVRDAARGIPRKMRTAQVLEAAGQAEEAMSVLREVISDGESELMDRLFAASTIASTIAKYYPEAADAPSSQRYAEMRQYLRMAQDLYNHADIETQSHLQKVQDIEAMRQLLRALEAGEPVGGKYGKGSGNGGCFGVVLFCLLLTGAIALLLLP